MGKDPSSFWNLDDAQLHYLVGLEHIDSFILKPDLPFSRLQNAGYGSHNGALSGPVGPDDSGYGPLGDPGGDTADRLGFSIMDGGRSSALVLPTRRSSNPMEPRISLYAPYSAMILMAGAFNAISRPISSVTVHCSAGANSGLRHVIINSMGITIRARDEMGLGVPGDRVSRHPDIRLINVGEAFFIECLFSRSVQRDLTVF